MFDFVHKKKRIVQIILALATLPFLFWGIESYNSSGEGGEDYLALVAGEKIMRQEFEQALRNQQENMRAAMGGSLDDAMLESPQLRAMVLDRLIQQRLLKHEAVRVGLTVPDTQLISTIQEIPAFQEDGAFSKQRYETLLRGQGMNPRMFEARVRQEILRQQLTDAYAGSSLVADRVTERILRLGGERREISLTHIQPEQFLSQVKPDEAAIQAYYDSHQAEFRLPEQVRVEYLVLSLDDLIQDQSVSAEEVQEYFEGHRSDFEEAEERRASHILIKAPAEAAEAERSAARARAEQLLIQVRREPQRFAELAGQHSEDPGSASQGGDLDFFARGMMVKAFEDAVFGMQPDEISDLVETDYGYHIIRLTGIRPARSARLDEVRAQVEQELKKQKASAVFDRMAEEFGNVVYEQSESLQPAAEKFGLHVQQSGWIAKGAGEPPYFSHVRLQEAIFSEDTLRNRRNTEAVEVAHNTLISARVAEHRQAATPPLAVLKDEISERLVRERASDLARSTGKEALAGLQAGGGSVRWGDAQEISRQDPGGVDPAIIRAAFRVSTTSLPVYAGVENSQGGYTLIRVSRVVEPAPANAAERANFSRQLRQVYAQEEFASYLDGIRKQYNVTVKEDLERK
ncbi:SurA N-terminal domain-containing protein [Nitrosovibrio sp. Nv17]|uniref:SurA N-terminal domain-containing protein n=1 Tax=Nitrosovibrio sp. Nv17 TaxID=1855339 RepID=UPI000909013E|nr:SurA N-terminal domain-containing protein [Nitrosovibrio sp. Nv17]SFW27260.1 peptidyl-prolyl cis-trans isomerase D [Nitrosovibrio sp. Nv17]